VINESGFGSIKIDKCLYDKIQREYKDFIELESKKEYVEGLEKALQIVEQCYSKFCDDPDYNVHHNYYYYDIIHELRKALKK
jgi:hypothetical protein